MKFHTLLTAAVALNAWVVPVYGTDEISNQVIAQMGAPEPGSVSDQETTQKQRNPAKEHRTDRNTQVTLGGAKSVVAGEVLKIDGDYHFVKDDDTGEEVRLLVDKDTRKICKSETASEATSQPIISKRGGSPDPQASEGQIRQGQRKDETAMGSGVQMGQSSGCSFRAGDRVKADVSDVGTVTTIRYLSEPKSSQRGAPAPLRDDSAGSMGESQDRSPSAEKLAREKEKVLAPSDLRSEGSGGQTALAPTRSAPEQDVKGEVVRGRILKIENEFFTVKNTAGKEVRLHVDKNTHRGQVNLKDEEFKEGDRIEAYMSPKGHAITITLIRGQGNMPGDPEGGG